MCRREHAHREICLQTMFPAHVRNLLVCKSISLSIALRCNGYQFKIKWSINAARRRRCSDDRMSCVPSFRESAPSLIKAGRRFNSLDDRVARQAP
jgi:hypothetical protein